MAGRLAAHATSAASASASSGTWAGCTTRSATSSTTRPPPLPPPRAHVQPALRVQRELHPAAVARRGRARQGLAVLEDGGRPLAEAREPARAVRLHVGAPRQEAPVHGRRAGPGGGVEPRALARLAPARAARARRRPAPGARPEPPLPRGGPRCGSSTPSRRASVARAQRRRAQHRRALRARRDDARALLVCVCNLSPVPRTGYRLGLPRGRALARGAQHGLRALRRQRRRQPRRDRRRSRCPGTASRARPS